MSIASAFGLKRSTLLPLTVLVGLTLVTQLASLAATFDGNFLAVLGPSAIVLCAVTIPLAALGLMLGQTIGLGAPLVTDLLYRTPGSGKKLLQDAKLAIPLGLALGISLLLLRFVAQPYLPPELPTLGHRGIWGGLMVSIGAAVGEEVWMRLGVLTILAWTVLRLLARQDVSPVVGWSAIVVSALVFAAMHLPQLASYGAADRIGIAATMMGNTLVGVLFGFLYWRRSLIAAMLAHFAVDLALHVLPALGT
ncbi:CAAX amino terminal protease self- immunity [Stieleria maiorica]|uniref:CAAX amino terminal protease self-immunity n=1 Tax=Stieleria maiorica TaxID=2795974 RepID=A0A5B9M9Q2_9BACT|nr:CPBP family intramembrane glutamic endopeptidase [Stieleria maiorica]QEF97932.1 CAAX amino terminal protease self- immunity [Stieleria maiorica]